MGEKREKPIGDLSLSENLWTISFYSYIDKFLASEKVQKIITQQYEKMNALIIEDRKAAEEYAPKIALSFTIEREEFELDVASNFKEELYGYFKRRRKTSFWGEGYKTKSELAFLNKMLIWEIEATAIEIALQIEQTYNKFLQNEVVTKEMLKEYMYFLKSKNARQILELRIAELES